MSGVLKKACWLLPVLFVVSPVLAQQGGGIQSAANIESHISFMSVFRGLLGIVSLLAIAWLFSKDRKAISWKVVAMANISVLGCKRLSSCWWCSFWLYFWNCTS